KNDVDTTQRAIQTNFKANFGYMLVKILKFLCHEIGVSEADLKLNNPGKEKMIDIDNSIKEVYGKGNKSNFELDKAFAKVFNNGLVVTKNEEAKGYNDQSSLHLPFLDKENI
ncbi:4372_t:CDS:2, partial [Cetraspora pellucida]